VGNDRQKKIKNKIFFFDRDGVLIRPKIINNKPYSFNTIKEINFCRGIKSILSLTKKLGYINVMITNQPDVARKKIHYTQVVKINSYIQKELSLDAVYMCTHEEKNRCRCRKPKIGLIIKAQKEWNANLNKSYIVGDRWKDIMCGIQAKIKTIFINYSYHEKYVTSNYSFKSILSLSKKIKSILNNDVR